MVLEGSAGHKQHISPPRGAQALLERAPAGGSIDQIAGSSHLLAQSAGGREEGTVEPDHWASLEPGQECRDHLPITYMYNIYIAIAYSIIIIIPA